MNVDSKLNFILKQNEKQKLSHAFLLETNNISECYKEVKQIIKQINCPQTYKDKCQNDCNLCKLIETNNLPSFITIEPDGMQIKREQIEDLMEKFSYKPLYSKYNIYVILNADKMNLISANKLLKFLEEPEENIVGFFITNNKENILSTIKSRCESIHIDYNSQAILDDEMQQLIRKYLDRINSNDYYLANKEEILSKYTERYDIEKIYLNIYYLFQADLKNDIANFKNNLKKLQIINKVLNFIKSNVNIELAMDYFVIEMRKVNE